MRSVKLKLPRTFNKASVVFTQPFPVAFTQPFPLTCWAARSSPRERCRCRPPGTPCGPWTRSSCSCRPRGCRWGRTGTWSWRWWPCPGWGLSRRSRVWRWKRVRRRNVLVWALLIWVEWNGHVCVCLQGYLCGGANWFSLSNDFCRPV